MPIYFYANIFLCQYNPLISTIIGYNGFFENLKLEIYKFFQSYLISCLVQLLRTSDKMFPFTLKFKNIKYVFCGFFSSGKVRLFNQPFLTEFLKTFKKY